MDVFVELKLLKLKERREGANWVFKKLGKEGTCLATFIDQQNRQYKPIATMIRQKV